MWLSVTVTVNIVCFAGINMVTNASRDSVQYMHFACNISIYAHRIKVSASLLHLLITLRIAILCVYVLHKNDRRDMPNDANFHTNKQSAHKTNILFSTNNRFDLSIKKKRKKTVQCGWNCAIFVFMIISRKHRQSRYVCF